jgi:tRNA acetyltransferase TAN1
LQYAAKLYGQDQIAGTAENNDSDEDEGDIEAEIRKEIDDIRKPAVAPLFMSVKLDTQCCKLHHQ